MLQCLYTNENLVIWDSYADTQHFLSNKKRALVISIGYPLSEDIQCSVVFDVLGLKQDIMYACQVDNQDTHPQILPCTFVILQISTNYVPTSCWKWALEDRHLYNFCWVATPEQFLSDLRSTQQIFCCRCSVVSEIPQGLCSPDLWSTSTNALTQFIIEGITILIYYQYPQPSSLHFTQLQLCWINLHLSITICLKKLLHVDVIFRSTRNVKNLAKNYYELFNAETQVTKPQQELYTTRRNINVDCPYGFPQKFEYLTLVLLTPFYEIERLFGPCINTMMNS